MFLRTSGKTDCYRIGVDRIAEDRVSKFVGPNVETEYVKACAIERALAGSRFSTPKPLTYDVAAGRVEFEYIPETVRLFEVIERAYRENDSRRAVAANRDAAELLALVHRNLKLPSAAHWVLPKWLTQDIQQYRLDVKSLDEVYMHCDFSPVNILITPASELVLIDPSPNDYFTDRADLKGPRYVSLATYTAKLFWPFRFRMLSSRWRRLAHQLRHDFISQYEHTSGVSIDRQMLCLFERAVVRSFVAWKTPVVPIRWAALLMSRAALPNCKA